MTEDPTHAAVLKVLAENGVTSIAHDLDTLATLIVTVVNNPAAPDATTIVDDTGE